MANRAVDLVLTHIKGEGIFLKFWALTLQSLETVKNFETFFRNKAKELDCAMGFLTSEQIPINSICVVKSKIKNMWCRARVLGHQGKNIFVQLMDYGNEESIQVSDVRNAGEELTSISAQASECILADVIPAHGNEWPPEAIRFCEQHILYNTLSCYFVSEYMKLPIVRIAKKGENGPFVQRMINAGMAFIKDEKQGPQMLSFKINSMDPSTTHLIRVSCVESVHRFYVQLSVAEMELKNLMDTLNRIPVENLQMLKSAAVNTSCLAQLALATKPCFYRARIISVHNTHFKVFFVDYGFTEFKEIQDLRVIPNIPEFFSLAAQALCCSLPRDTNVNAETLKCLVNSEHLECQILNKTAELYLVKLFRQGKDIETASLTYPKPKLSVGTKYEVTVSYVNGLTDFYVQLNHFKDQLNFVSSILNSLNNFVPISFMACTPGKPVCVKYSVDNLWYRAQIVTVKHESDISVFFVDYGNYDSVSLSAIRNISPDILKIPIQALKCYLFDTPIPSDSKARDVAFDLVDSLTADPNVVAHVREHTGEDSGYGLTLFSKNSTESINDKIMYLSLSIPVNNIENIYVTSFETMNSFFAQLEKLDSNELLRMQEEINVFYSGSQNTAFIPKEGDLVCACFHVDESFYRAKVEKVAGGVCQVFFIDYGNKEKVPIKDVHLMETRFKKYPQFGIQCALCNIPPGVSDDEMCGLLLENSFQVEMIRQVEDKWIVSLTDNYINNDPVLQLIKKKGSVVPRSIHGQSYSGYSEISETPNNPPAYTSSRNIDNEPRKPAYPDQQKGRRSTPLPDDQEIRIFSYPSMSANAFRNVYVSHVISPGEFYCQLEEDISKLHALMTSIDDAYSTYVPETLTFSKFIVNEPCCAVFEESAWNRGIIKKVNQNSCDIFFVDFGNTDEVPNSKVKQLRSTLFTYPVQAIRCKSYNISPKGRDWSEDEINAFINMTLDKSFVAQFVECDSDGVQAVNLVSIGKIEHDIFNKEFVNLGFGRFQNASNSLVSNSHAAATNLTFITPNVEVGTTQDVEVTYGLNPGEIFCQLKSSAEDFKKMMLNLQNHYNKISEQESIIERPYQGMICVAQFHMDSAWYRAEIRKVEANKVFVFYVDYGNLETVQRNKVRCIFQNFTSLPVQAIKCRIRGIKPIGKAWSVNNSISSYFEGNATCKFMSKEGDFYLVDMMCNQKHVAQLLMADKIAVSDGTIPEIKLVVPPVVAEPQQSISQLPNRKLTFVPGQLVVVEVSFIESPSRFWCQLLDEVDVLDQIMADIEAKYQNSSDPLVDAAVLRKGSLCIAQYYGDEAWYRAQIINFRPDNSCDVFFVDYGNTEAVSLAQIKPVLPQFLKHPPQCFECSLQNCPQKTDPDSKTLFQSVVDEAEEITAKIEKVASGICTVSLLYDKDDNEVNVGELLFGTSSGLEPSSDSIGAARFLPPDVPLGLQEGFVSIVNTPQDFYIQLAGTEDTLTDLSAEFSDICESSQEILKNLCVGAACGAKFSEDDSWYRAEITAIHDSTVDVLFVDYGNVDTVEKNSVRSLTDKHLQMPPFAIKCKLNGIAPVADKWTEDAINIFQQLVEDSCLGITFISKDIPAAVNITKDDKEIAHCLIDSELAGVETSAENDEAYAEDHLAPSEDPFSSLPTDQTYPKRKLSSTKLAIKICYTDSYDKFYVMPLELSTELDTIMTTLELLYTEGNPESKTPVLGDLEDSRVSMPCVAKYSVDEAWYRALITDINGENISVLFVDYGNLEITTISNLRPITPELVEIPPIALECILYGLEAVPSKEADITAKLEDFVAEETELEMEVFEVSPYKVKLYSNGNDIGAMLIQEGLAIEKIFEPSTEETFEDNSKMSLVDGSLELKIQIYKRLFTDVDKIVGNVKFCEVESEFVTFYVVSNDLEQELQNLQQKLQDAYAQAPRNLLNASCMDFCATKYMEDENWYRAQILIFDKDKVKVRFIDYGNCETVDRSDIYELLPDFTIERQFSVKCILFGLRVNKNKEVELQNTLDDYVYHDSVELKLCNYSHTVSDPCITSVICGNTDLSELILNEKLVFKQYIINTQLDDEFNAILKKLEGEVLYLFPLHLTNEQDNFQFKLQDSCKDLNISPSQVGKDQLYAARIDDTWHRISVKDVSDNTITVYLVDFGMDKTVDVADIVLLPDDFCHQPLFLQPCTTENIDISKLSIGETLICKVIKTNPVDQTVKIHVSSINSVIQMDQSSLDEKNTVEVNAKQDIDENGTNLKSSDGDVEDMAIKAEEYLEVDDSEKNVENRPANADYDINKDAENCSEMNENVDDLNYVESDTTVDAKKYIDVNDIIEDCKNELTIESTKDAEKCEEMVDTENDIGNEITSDTKKCKEIITETDYRDDNENDSIEDTEKCQEMITNENDDVDHENDLTKDTETCLEIVDTEKDLDDNKSDTIGDTEKCKEMIDTDNDDVDHKNDFTEDTETCLEIVDTEKDLDDNKNVTMGDTEKCKEIIDTDNDDVDHENDLTEDTETCLEIVDTEKDLDDNKNDTIGDTEKCKEMIDTDNVDEYDNENDSNENTDKYQEIVDTEKVLDGNGYGATEDTGRWQKIYDNEDAENDTIECTGKYQGFVDTEEDAYAAINTIETEKYVEHNHNEIFDHEDFSNTGNCSKFDETENDAHDAINVENKISEHSKEYLEVDEKEFNNTNAELKITKNVENHPVDKICNKEYKGNTVGTPEDLIININETLNEDAINTKQDKFEDALDSDLQTVEVKNTIADLCDNIVINLNCEDISQKLEEKKNEGMEDGKESSEICVEHSKVCSADNKLSSGDFVSVCQNETDMSYLNFVSSTNENLEIDHNLVSNQECIKKTFENDVESLSDTETLLKTDSTIDDCDKIEQNVGSSDIHDLGIQDDSKFDTEIRKNVKSVDVKKIETSFKKDFDKEEGKETDFLLNYNNANRVSNHETDLDSNDCEKEHNMSIDSDFDASNIVDDVEKSQVEYKSESFVTHRSIDNHTVVEGTDDVGSSDTHSKTKVYNLTDSNSGSKSKNSRGIPESDQLFGSVHVKVSDIAVSDGSVVFAVQLLDRLERLLHLKTSMQNTYLQDSEEFSDNYEETLCAVYHENEWCRGKILQKCIDSSTIMLIDYGKCETFVLTDMKNLHPEFCNEPAFAVWCTLAGISCSDENSDTAKQLLSNIVKNKECVIKILDGDEPYKIDLFVDNSSILNKILEEGVATQTLPQLRLESGSYSAEVSYLNLGTKSSEMFVHLTSFSQTYETLSKSIQNTYKIEDSIVSQPSKYGIYAFFHNNSWHRGNVLSLDPLRIHLVDVGNIISNYTNSSVLSLEHCLQAPLAISCRLPFSNLPEAVDCVSVEKLLKGKCFQVDINSSPDMIAISATLADEDVLEELKALVPFYHTDHGSVGGTTVKEEIFNSEDSDDDPCPHEAQQSRDHIVSYLEETFTTDPT